MGRIRLPIALWPLRYHLGAALLSWVVVAVLLLVGVRQLAQYEAQLRQDTAALEQDLLQAQQRRQPSTAAPDLLERLPIAARSEDLTRDIARFAQTHGVQLQTLAIEPRRASENQWPQEVFLLTAQSSYPAFKSWLSELQDRYPALVLQTLSLQASTQTPGQLDVRASLAWYLRAPQN